MEEKVIEFYRRVVFGSDYIAKVPENQKESKIIGWCFDAAWADMSRHTLTFKNANLTEKDKQSKRKEFKSKFKEIFNDYRTYKTNYNIKNKILECLNIWKHNEHFTFTYGQAQKLVNMFFKYLYTFKTELNLNKEYFNMCDCPIDKINLKRIHEYEKKYNYREKYVCYKNGTYCLKYRDNNNEIAVPWSKLDNETVYNNIQYRIDEIINQETSKDWKTRLDFEFDWE